MATTLQPGALTPSQTQQTGSKKAVSLIDSLLTQPSLPQGTSITPQVQNVQTNELLTTPGVTGTVAAQSTAATAPTAAGVTGATPTAVWAMAWGCTVGSCTCCGLCSACACSCADLASRL